MKSGKTFVAFPVTPSRLKRVINRAVCGLPAGQKESRPALECLGQPGGFQRGSDYCWPMILPLMSMLSSTTILEPVSGPPSSTR